MRKINRLGLETLKLWEGRKGGQPALFAYFDSAVVPTIGWGHTKGVKIGTACTREQAEKWLSDDVYIAEHAVTSLVTVPLNDNQFAALVLFAYNVGNGAFKNSSLLKILNAGNYQAVPDQLLRWNKATIDGKLTVVKGLTNRRNAEIALWKTPVTNNDIVTVV